MVFTAAAFRFFRGLERNNGCGWCGG